MPRIDYYLNIMIRNVNDGVLRLSSSEQEEKF